MLMSPSDGFRRRVRLAPPDQLVFGRAINEMETPDPQKSRKPSGGVTVGYSPPEVYRAVIAVVLVLIEMAYTVAWNSRNISGGRTVIMGSYSLKR
jgi:hypothetical protein